MDFTSFLLSFQPLQAGNIFSPFYFIFFHVLRCWHVFDMEEKISWIKKGKKKKKVIKW